MKSQVGVGRGGTASLDDEINGKHAEGLASRHTPLDGRAPAEREAEGDAASLRATSGASGLAVWSPAVTRPYRQTAWRREGTRLSVVRVVNRAVA
jgi:hypothetical protein